MCILLAGLLLMAGSAFGQAAERDSLLNLYRHAKTDTARVWALMETGKLYLRGQTDTAAFYLKQALDMANQISFDRGRAKCLINLSSALNAIGLLDSSAACCLAAIPICSRMHMHKEMVAAYNNMGNAYRMMGSYQLAILAYENALSNIPLANVPPAFPSAILGNLSDLYGNLRQYEKQYQAARQAYQKAEEAASLYDKAITANKIGNACIGLKQKEEARRWFTSSVTFAREAEAPLIESVALMNLAEMLQSEGHLAEVRAIYEKTLAISQEYNEPSNRMMSLHGLALTDMEEGKLASAKRNAQLALDDATLTQNNAYLSYILLLLSDISLLENDLGKHQEYRNAYQTIRDTLVNTDVLRAVQEMETLYETRQKEQRIRQLEQEKEIQGLRLAASLAGGSSALLLLALGALGYRNLQRRKTLADNELKLQQQTILSLEQEKQLLGAQAMLQGQETERSRLARDLHDGLGGMLSGVKQSLTGMKGNQILPEGSVRALNQAIEDMDRSIGELRHIARNMMPEALLRFGLKDALQDYCDHIGQSTGLRMDFQAFGMEERIPEQMEIVLFRVAQELLNNVMRHARASHCLVQIIRDGQRLHLTVEDNGKGFDPALAQQATGVGWLNIRSRVSYLGGTIDVQSKPGAGTSVTLECMIP